MAVNLPGPYFIEITYETSGLNHKMGFSCQVSGTPVVGTSSDLIDILQRDATTVTLTNAVNDFVDLLKPMFQTVTTFIDFTLWQYVTGTLERNFVSTGALGVAGTSAGSAQTAHQATSTFRTQNGGILKLVMLESIFSDNDVVALSSVSNTALLAISAFIVSTDSWLYARDNSYPIAPLNFSGGQNEALFRKRYRSGS